MSVDTWDEIRTAYHVARLGTVSGAADALGVHHATVIRHVDALEARLGAKLFQRHARGYTATEAGADLLQVAATTEDQFTQLVGRIRGRGADVTGELIVTSLPTLSPRLVPLLTQFLREFPETRLRFLTDERLFRLEYGEAHVAVRAGSKPDQPDNIVQPFYSEQLALYATRAYVDEMGPLVEGEWGEHRFIGHDDREHRAPFFAWLTANVPEENIVLRVSQQRVSEDAVGSGIGIGFRSVRECADNPDFVQLLPPKKDWIIPIWLVTHVDLHRTTKVQALVNFLKSKTDELSVADP